jgi:23S rRNA pseudouridine2605 synthase
MKRASRPAAGKATNSSRATFKRPAAGVKHAPPTAPAQGIRINRYLGMSGVSSRRKAEDFVLGGRVTVNRSVVTDLGHRIDPERDHVAVDGKPVSPVHERVYLVLNKPNDTITTLSDERGRPTVMGLIHSRHRIYPIGRLDRKSTGVLLLTNDGEFANRLMHPRFEVPKTYRVKVDRSVGPHHLQSLAGGVPLRDGMTAQTDVIVIPRSKGKEMLITLHEGRNRQIRRMFEELGYSVTKLDRVAYGPVTCEGLGRGETRHLSKRELRQLMKLAGIQMEWEE